MSEKITILASSKSFGELSESEKSLVLEETTEAEFNMLSKILRTAPLLDAAVAPPPQLKTALMEQLAMPGVVHVPWYNRSMPLWQTAATMAVLLAVVWFFQPNPGESDAVVETVVQTDTVFVDKIVWKEKVVIRRVIVHQPADQVPVAIDAPDKVHRKAILPESTISGASIGTQPELFQFFTSACGTK